MALSSQLNQPPPDVAKAIEIKSKQLADAKKKEAQKKLLQEKKIISERFINAGLKN